MPVATFVSNIERDEVKAHTQQTGERVDLEGELSDKLIEQREELEVRGGVVGYTYRGKGRRVDKNVVVAVIAQTSGTRTYSVRCEFEDYGAKQLSEIAIGTRVTVTGKVRNWRKDNGAVVPQLENCFIWPAGG